MSILTKSKRKRSSREQIAIEGVRDGLLILPGHEYRLILALSSINFELMSDAEQDALVDMYQSFLNSVGFSLQLLVRIREMDLDRYLNGFKSSVSGEKVAVYKNQAKNYIEFVHGLVKDNKILTRQFYVVVPLKNESKDFGLVKNQMDMKANMVLKGLNKLGIQGRALDSLDALDLFYTFYNPRQAKVQPLRQETLLMLKEALV